MTIIIFLHAVVFENQQWELKPVVINLFFIIIIMISFQDSTFEEVCSRADTITYVSYGKWP